MKKDLLPDEALELLFETVDAILDKDVPPYDFVPLEEALGRILPYPVYSPVDQPPFPKAAMDGYAYNDGRSEFPPYPPQSRTFFQESPSREERPVISLTSKRKTDRTDKELLPEKEQGAFPFFRVVGTIKAGERFPRPLAPGEAVRIMTGAPIPQGVVGVQRVEWTRLEGDRVYFTRPETTFNRIEAGENSKAGDLLLTPRILHSQDIGILAAAGYYTIGVSKKPRLAVFSTGDEIKPPCCTVSPPKAINQVGFPMVAPTAMSVPPSEPSTPAVFPFSQGTEVPLIPAQTIVHLIQQARTKLAGRYIFDSNGYQLTAHALSAGAQAQFLGILPDEPKQIYAKIEETIQNYEILILSGGVSMGDYDYLPRIVQELGFTILFHGLAMRPGKPSLCAFREGRILFGLPGNPVSTFVNFEVLIRPLLYRLMGLQWEVPRFRGILTEDLHRKGTDRVEFLPVRFDYEQQQVVPLPYRGSSMITVFAQANGLIRMEIGISQLKKGETVYVRPVRPFY
ncbi:MAG: molybdopterin molybdotransferase MoeA [Treponemataceae bacterium]|nr:molybdopterin molybdotransferase MoeA [Treponemataceae bacterium]